MQVVVLKRLAGKSVREAQFCQVLRKPVLVLGASEASPVAADRFSDGKDVKLTQLHQASAKLVPDDVSMLGKVVSWLRLYQVARNLVPADVFKSGKLVKLGH